ncbi:hypothetical protein [Asaia prunellae]|uniref:hypothetical protein n=1 Tax=Asaia prunellae TaxID=610245 RepID=UPI00046EB8AF|nr:hypothetical protein [Asaia prunellae]
MIHSYAILSQETVSRVTDEAGETLEPLRLIQGHNAQIGEHVFSLATNLPALEAVAILASGDTVPLTLSTHNGDLLKLTVTRL